MSMSDPSEYTAEVEHSEGTLRITETKTFPNAVKDNALTSVPVDVEIHRVGVWSGGTEDRPDGGHEDGILRDDHKDRNLYEINT